MPSIWCKICGITSLDDAIAAQQAGADALGFNCFPASPRFVAADQIGAMAAEVSVTRVALFVDPSEAQVAAVLEAADIDLLQFHGEEPEAFCNRFGLPYMKVLRMRENANFAAWAESYASAWALMLDTYVTGQPGGTGQRFDWRLWPHQTGQRLVVAGGLSAANVADAVTTLDPFGVDVAGGVEGSVKGVKDHQKVVQFIQEVRGARR